ncbi:uracil DNA glycosylase [Tieghemiomyces parasiticus]|uniref:Uracil-DNA glycosylase n=1 Tax=Tieghemiomyces parasiticus TaxID=78921 RepID=A0A9W8AES0_9FUNG|nr:uracil DNA glycosylase [Tieghemiomyces parasiticus]
MPLSSTSPGTKKRGRTLNDFFPSLGSGASPSKKRDRSLNAASESAAGGTPPGKKTKVASEEGSPMSNFAAADTPEATQDKASKTDSSTELAAVVAAPPATKVAKAMKDRNNQADAPVPALDQINDPATRELLRLEYETLDPSWLRVLAKEITKPYFLKLKRFLQEEKAKGQEVFPPPEDIYSWSRYTPAPEVRVVILGQDPYHNNNQAHGLCFSVRKGIRTPPSLVNMYTALERDYPDFKRPNHGYLAAWAAQGVLMLNAALTVRAHNANSHSKMGWEEFTDAVIQYVNEKRSQVVFLLWGSYAQKKGSGIDKKKHLVLKSVHPSPLSAHRGFFDCHHFKQTNDYLRSHGKPTIDWGKISES